MKTLGGSDMDDARILLERLSTECGGEWSKLQADFEKNGIREGRTMEGEQKDDQGMYAYGETGDAALPQLKPHVDGLTRFSTGSVRSSDADSTRYDLISTVGLRRLAETYAEGARKYGDRNWEKGQPVTQCLNHLLAHINKWRDGDSKEDHLAHAAWGLMAIMHFEERLPEMIDVPSRANITLTNTTPLP